MQGRTVLGKYIVDRLLGQGSMGQVYLAWPKVTGSEVVVKTMSDRLAGQPKFRELFTRELQMMARFRHPHAVQLIEGGVDAHAGPCIVMEYVPGPNLSEALELYKRFDSERVAGILVPICQALHAAHSVGIIHRDLKPANVKLINPGTPAESAKVMDLGLAALTDKPYIPLEKLRGSRDEFAVGSPAYMCPEQIRGDGIDPRADLYSLGVMLYELLTGYLPYEDEDVGMLLHAHVNRAVPRLADAGTTDVPRAVEAVVMRCLAKYPVERPASAMELAREFHEALALPIELDPQDYLPTVANDRGSGAGAPPANSGPDRLVHKMEAWMPEAIAIVKLRGFLEDIGANILTSEPGLIRVRLGEKPPARGGILGWFKKSPAGDGVAPMAIDLYLTKRPATANKLEVTTVIRALDGPLPDDPRWHSRAKQLQTELGGYLMAQR